MRIDTLKIQKCLNATAFRNEQILPWVQKKLINKILLRWFFFVSYIILCSAKTQPSFSHKWLKRNYWQYLHLPKNTAQPSAPSPEAEGQAVERKIATVKCVADCISQEFKQLFLGYQSRLCNNYLITILFHISLLQLSQGLLFSCFSSCAAWLWCVPRSSARSEFTLFVHSPFPFCKEVCWLLFLLLVNSICTGTQF